MAYGHLVHCGQTPVFIQARDKATLDSYLYANRNMVLKVKIDGEYIDSPCF